MPNWVEETDGNYNVAGLRVMRTGTPRKVIVNSPTPRRIDGATPEGRKVVHVQNLHATDTVNITLSVSPPASAPFILAAGEFRALLAGEGIGVYASKSASSAPVAIVEVAA